MTPVQKQFAAELEPLLTAVEQALDAGDGARSKQLALDMLAVTMKYSKRLERDQVREVLNGPTASAIAERLGVKPN